MFNNIYTKIDWSFLGEIGSRWKLLNFSESSPPTWDKYWAGQREYWGADRKDKTRVKIYFGKENTEEELLKKCRKGYEDFKNYIEHWHGLCKIGEIVEVINFGPQNIVLSKNWNGEIKDHSDLNFFLFEEKTFYRKHVQFCCKIYSYGTLNIPKNSFGAMMGERPGKSRVSHSRGKSKNKFEPLKLNKDKNLIEIGDAKFSILN